MKYFVSIILLLFVFGLSAQETIYVYGKAKEDKGGGLADVKITIKKNGSLAKTLTAPKNGKFDFDLEFDANYLITYSKEGYVSKTISFDSRVPVDKREELFKEFTFQVIMFAQPEGANMKFNQPVAKVKYDNAQSYFGYDLNYSKSIERELRKFEEEVKKKQEEALASPAVTNIPNPTQTLGSKKQNIDREAQRRNVEEAKRRAREQEAQRQADLAKKKAEEEQKVAAAKEQARLQEQKRQEDESRRKAAETRKVEEAKKRAHEEMQKKKEAEILAKQGKEALAKEKAREEKRQRVEAARIKEAEERRRVEEERQKALSLAPHDRDPEVRDGFYDRQYYKDKGVIPYEFVREPDVFWEKRIWRVVDVREKFNMHFVYPKEPLIQIILNMTTSGQVGAYSPIDDQFTTPMTPDEVKRIGAGYDTIVQIDPITFEEKIVVQEIELDLGTIKKFRIKEDWYFDKETSTMKVRIIGIAPIRDRYDDNGNFLGPEPMFWIYYPEARYIFAHHEVFNIKNDAQRMTWFDVFEARYFHGYIIKESNVQDRRIQDYATGIDGILEGERVHDDIFTFEHDLWTY